MILARFYVDKNKCGNDYRPVDWPIKYPYWCTGESINVRNNSECFILTAYADSVEQIKELWPEAQDISTKEVSEITFSPRLPKPQWYKEEK